MTDDIRAALRMNREIVKQDFDYAAVGVKGGDQEYLIKAVSKFHAAGNRTAEAYLEMGDILLDARPRFPRLPTSTGFKSGWGDWVQREIGMNVDTAQKMMYVRRAMPDLDPKSECLPSFTILRIIASSKTPEEVRNHILANPETTLADAIQIKKDISAQKMMAPLPSPKKAREIARKTGIPQAASDGTISFGATEADAQKATERRTLIYGVKDAIQKIADLDISPEEWLGHAQSWDFLEFNQNGEISQVTEWLDELNSIWSKKIG